MQVTPSEKKKTHVFPLLNYARARSINDGSSYELRLGTFKLQYEAINEATIGGTRCVLEIKDIVQVAAVPQDACYTEDLKKGHTSICFTGRATRLDRHGDLLASPPWMDGALRCHAGKTGGRCQVR